MDIEIMYDRLIPGFMGTGCFYDDSFVWTDARPQPTEQECLDEWVVYQAEEAIKANNITAYTTYHTALAAGYTHTDTYVYYCNERATTDLVKVLTLFDLDPSEPVTVITLDGTIRDLTYAEFEVLAKAIGNHQYSLRKAYWAALQR